MGTLRRGNGSSGAVEGQPDSPRLSQERAPAAVWEAARMEQLLVWNDASAQEQARLLAPHSIAPERNVLGEGKLVRKNSQFNRTEQAYAMARQKSAAPLIKRASEIEVQVGAAGATGANPMAAGLLQKIKTHIPRADADSFAEPARQRTVRTQGSWIKPHGERRPGPSEHVTRAQELVQETGLPGSQSLNSHQTSEGTYEEDLPNEADFDFESLEVLLSPGSLARAAKVDQRKSNRGDAHSPTSSLTSLAVDIEGSSDSDK
ncbi:hypothetical protein FVE85_8088 [Porphyridium purpureum]|uniref:Uncharacterized protein n=1 Tax=Porphyridium purpureum TaxID=35688 RepID=A0A5J4YM72_PORPP|nr:hypothetical protein FVE85_8088 [Porphyridium purpureum]|eukprot:POR2811..scf295_9